MQVKVRCGRRKGRCRKESGEEESVAKKSGGNGLDTSREEKETALEEAAKPFIYEIFKPWIIKFVQLEMLLAIGMLICILLPATWGENVTRKNSECILGDIESRLSIASEIIESTRQKLPKDLEELCRKTLNCLECKDRQHYTHPIDCSDIYESGERRDGMYDIWPQNRMSLGPLRVYCDMESNGGGWTVIQRRGDYKSPENYFYRDWNSYKVGFGDKLKDFWIGNDHLYALANQRSYQLRVNLTDWEGNSTYATYDEFWISDEAGNYALHVKEYRGTAGDSLDYHNEMLFSAKDRDNDIASSENCAETRGGAWWYKSCTDCNLNGKFLGRDGNSAMSVTWYKFRGNSYSLKEAVMKIRPSDFNVISAN